MFLYLSMIKLDALKNILCGIWCIGYFLRIVGKLTDLYEIPIWSIYLTIASFILWTTLSLTMYFNNKKKK